MKDFKINDLLTHIIHGGIILFIACISFECVLGKLQNFPGFMGKEGSLFSVFGLTFLLFLSYLIGLILDPIADLVDTLQIKCAKFFSEIFLCPSYLLLRDGECCYLRLAHNAQIREKLSRLAVENDNLISDGERKSITGEEKEKVWKNKGDAMLLLSYAKDIVYANYTTEKPYQVQKMEAYFRLFIFYRNMMWTTIFSAFLLFFSSNIHLFYCNCCRYMIIPVAIILVMFFFWVSRKYRTYYCRAVLGAVYSPEDKSSSSFVRRMFGGVTK